MSKLLDMLRAELDRLAHSDPGACARVSVEAALRAYAYAASAAEREAVAAQIALLDNGGARFVLADYADHALGGQD